MKFGKYLDSQKASLPKAWSNDFLNYKGLKDKIKKSAEEEEASGAAGVAFSPRETSLSVVRHRTDRDAAEESFFELLEAEVSKVGAFTSKLVGQLKDDVKQLQGKAETDGADQHDALLAEAKRIGDEFLALEKYVNLNYLGFHKAVKKHDKMLPLAPCQQFYMHVLRNQPWVQGDHSELLVQLSSVYSRLRDPESSDTLPPLALRTGSVRGPASRALSYAGSDFESIASPSGYGPAGRTTKRYWVRTTDVSSVKHHILQHLGVSSAASGLAPGGTTFVNAVYLDNTSLELYHGLLDKRPGATTMRIKWMGAKPGDQVMLERRLHDGNDAEVTALPLPERFVVPFLQGTLTEQEFVRNLKRLQSSGEGMDDAEVRRLAQLFGDLSRVVSAKQLAPMLRTQAMRSAYGDASEGGNTGIRVLLDTNVIMLKENPYDAVVAERWNRDLSQQVPRTELTRFPHAVLDIQMDPSTLHNPPAWLEELSESGYVTDVYAFSKMLHGVATLLPDSLQAVPYWVDDESVRASMAASGPSPPRSIEGTVRPMGNVPGSTPVRRAEPPSLETLSHPLLGPAPTLQLMPDRTDVAGFQGQPANEESKGLLAWWFLSRDREKKLDSLDLPLLGRESEGRQAVPPKNVMALERTYLAWAHMSLTVGAIAAAIAGVSGTSKTHQGEHAAEKKGIERSEDVVALIMMVMAAAISAYALYVYLQRSKMLKEQVEEDAFVSDGKRGIQAIVIVIVGSLSAIFIISLIDFFLML
mmetsp:Transcript_6084/g.17418  ORF Transcript_6084/g.17418 Transcript_6084/m.17418 type:complete len:754 (-) Transcript_6084:271-2532(-)|eukprot:CAMPEP_0206143842 /NCGR_PEP_ID=MMETSP1473-20131121/22012_1 /ASSEMBLY_ACC=CAM_ASM_001109 /TAXON_ID=1461547 /ORGANISM="Stichococcus sp, Strain RCC1054" /LENGTH=753 /DNA_ID=CAMNT_0053539425 /DNA_START=196 /DNA_END=2457 /DNA_ORIENTATION=+